MSRQSGAAPAVNRPSFLSSTGRNVIRCLSWQMSLPGELPQPRGVLGELPLGDLDELVQVDGRLKGSGARDGHEYDRSGDEKRGQPQGRGEQGGDAARDRAGPTRAVLAVLALTAPFALLGNAAPLFLLGNKTERGYGGITVRRGGGGRERGMRDGAGGQRAVARLRRRALVGPSFDGVADFGG